MFLDASQGLASITAVHRNDLLPKRSTGGLLADCLQQIGLLQPAIIEAHNVIEKTTLAVLMAGGDGQGTVLGNLLEDTARALGGTAVQWQTIKDGSAYHLRVDVLYP